MACRRSSFFRSAAWLWVLMPLFLLVPSARALDRSEPGTAGASILYPEPVPFSLDAESAIGCINLLKRVQFLELRDEEDGCSIVTVRTVWSYFLGYDESYPEGHRLRYDIIVNGEPLDWDRCFIEYGYEMVNLHLLFLYRNMHPSGEQAFSLSFRE